jgi:hypothetical protein
MFGATISAMCFECAARGQMCQRAFGPREVDQHLRVGEALGDVMADVERAGQRAIGRCFDGLDQHASHAPRRAGHRDFQRHAGSSGG